VPETGLSGWHFNSAGQSAKVRRQRQEAKEKTQERERTRDRTNDKDRDGPDYER
jgi:hypothetical protein